MRKFKKPFTGKKFEREKTIVLLVDGFPIAKEFLVRNSSQKAIIKGDCKSISIAAASIIAKVERDTFMAKLGMNYPHYGWDRNKGYGTKEHLDSLKSKGHSKHHRLKFI